MHPFTAMRDYRLTCGNIDLTISVADAQATLEDYRELIKLWLLSGFFPALRTTHVGNADTGGRGIHTPDIFVDQFGFASCSGDSGRLSDQRGHARTLARNRVRELRLPGSETARRIPL